MLKIIQHRLSKSQRKEGISLVGRSVEFKERVWEEFSNSFSPSFEHEHYFMFASERRPVGMAMTWHVPNHFTVWMNPGYGTNLNPGYIFMKFGKQII